MRATKSTSPRTKGGLALYATLQRLQHTSKHLPRTFTITCGDQGVVDRSDAVGGNVLRHCKSEQHSLQETMRKLATDGVHTLQDYSRRVSYLEHFTSAFTVTCSDERRVDIYEAPRLEEGVGSMCQGVANAGNSPYEVGSGPQVQSLSKALYTLALLAEGVLALAIVTFAQPKDLVCFQLHFLQDMV